MNSVTEALKTKAYVAPFAVFMGFTLVWQFGSPFLEWDLSLIHISEPTRP